MKCLDLQIGDWVLIKSLFGGYHTTPIKIAAVHQKKVGYHKVPDKLNWARFGLLEPIPLTSEILEKNGFTHCLTAPCGYYHAPAYEISHILFHISEDTYEDTYHTVVFTDHNDNNFVLFNLCYVHELQHALRLCGLKDLADNLKLEE